MVHTASPPCRSSDRAGIQHTLAQPVHRSRPRSSGAGAGERALTLVAEGKLLGGEPEELEHVWPRQERGANMGQRSFAASGERKGGEDTPALQARTHSCKPMPCLSMINCSSTHYTNASDVPGAPHGPGGTPRSENRMGGLQLLFREVVAGN